MTFHLRNLHETTEVRRGVPQAAGEFLQYAGGVPQAAGRSPGRWMKKRGGFSLFIIQSCYFFTISKLCSSVETFPVYFATVVSYKK
jgi:hypothetical protein